MELIECMECGEIFEGEFDINKYHKCPECYGVDVRFVSPLIKVDKRSKPIIKRSMDNQIKRNEFGEKK